MRRCGSGQRGAALILVLAVLSVLSVVAIEGLRLAQVEAVAAAASRHRLQAEELLDSGLKLSMALLAQDRSTYDHPAEPWAVYFSPEPEEGMRSSGPEQTRLRRVAFVSGELEGRIVPDDARLPVNQMTKPAVRKAFVRLLESAPFELERQRAEALADAVRDWVDQDGEGPYEEAAYREAQRPYGPANKALGALADLRLALGMSQELYDGGPGRPGLKEFLTVARSGKVNVNFAPREVLMALCPAEMSNDAAREFAQALMAYRANPANAEFLAEPTWYKTRLAGFSDPKLPDDLLTTQSQLFLVELTCRVGGVRRSLHAEVRREQAALPPGSGQEQKAQADKQAAAAGKVFVLRRELR